MQINRKPSLDQSKAAMPLWEVCLLQLILSFFSSSLFFSLAKDVTSAVRAEMIRRGQLLMGYSSLAVTCGDRTLSFPFFFRFVAVGRQLAPDNLVFALEHLKQIGKDLFP